jgi:hypothetical protein
MDQVGPTRALYLGVPGTSESEHAALGSPVPVLLQAGRGSALAPTGGVFTLNPRLAARELR